MYGYVYGTFDVTVGAFATKLVSIRRNSNFDDSHTHTYDLCNMLQLLVSDRVVLFLMIFFMTLFVMICNESNSILINLLKFDEVAKSRLLLFCYTNRLHLK